MSMVEIVARAMWVSGLERDRPGRVVDEVAWEDEEEIVRASFRDQARAAIAAMREPDGAAMGSGVGSFLHMIHAVAPGTEGAVCLHDYADPIVHEVWTAMCDAALSQAVETT